MTDLYERRVEAAQMASSLLKTPFGSSRAAEVTELADYLLHGKQTSGEETQTSGADFPESDLRPYLDQFNQAVTELVNQTFGDEVDLDALSIRILENLDLIGDASWHEEEDEELESAGCEALLYPQPSDADFGEIRVYVLEEFDALPTGSRVEYTSNVSDTIRYWEKREDGTWFPSDGDHETWYSYELESKDGRQLLNPEILGTFRPVERMPQPGDRGAHASDPNFGEIRIFTEEEYDALPASVRVEYFGNYPHWEKREDGTWFSGNDTHDVWHSHELCDGDGRRVLNPEILGTFRPVEA